MTNEGLYVVVIASKEYLATKRIRVATGTIVDATILHVHPSTKSEKKERDQAIRQTRKGQLWYSRLEAHIGMDSKTNAVHAVCTSAASLADCNDVD